MRCKPSPAYIIAWNKLNHKRYFFQSVIYTEKFYAVN